MIDRKLLFSQLQQKSDRLFARAAGEQHKVADIWQRVCFEPELSKRLSELAVKSSLACPVEAPGAVRMVSGNLADYHVVAVDGSQIYPDRHLPGGGCGLINIGGVAFAYSSKSSVEFFSEPELLAADMFGTDTVLTPELVDLVREKRELEVALEKSKAMPEGVPSLVFLDGTLTLSHIAGKSETLQKQLLKVSLEVAEALYKRNQLVAAYMSAPRSRDLVRLLKGVFCHEWRSKSSTGGGRRTCKGECGAEECAVLTGAVDVDLFDGMPSPSDNKYSVSAIFKAPTNKKAELPEQLMPHFCYINVGDEFARLEFPAWIATSQKLFESLCQMVCDQVRKGRGYPVALSEAHEKAVVSAAERRFFYELVGNVGVSRGAKVQTSCKLAKKQLPEI